MITMIQANVWPEYIATSVYFLPLAHQQRAQSQQALRYWCHKNQWINYKEVIIYR